MDKQLVGSPGSGGLESRTRRVVLDVDDTWITVTWSNIDLGLSWIMPDLFHWPSLWTSALHQLLDETLLQREDSWTKKCHQSVYFRSGSSLRFKVFTWSELFCFSRKYPFGDSWSLFGEECFYNLMVTFKQRRISISLKGTCPMSFFIVSNSTFTYSSFSRLLHFSSTCLSSRQKYRNQQKGLYLVWVVFRLLQPIQVKLSQASPSTLSNLFTRKLFLTGKSKPL